MSWDKFVKRYVWDDTKTPYFVPVRHMNRTQADHELFAYALFLAVLFAVISIASLSGSAPLGRSVVVSLGALAVVCGAICLGAAKNLLAAYLCASAPLAALAYFFVHGFHPRLDIVDEFVLLAVTLAIFRYSLRVVAIAKAYDDMPAAKGDE